MLLNVTRNFEDNSTTIGFVVTKSQVRNMLSVNTVLDAVKVKYILSAQLSSLSRVLGGVRIERIEKATLYRMPTYASVGGDNTKLFIILFAVASFLIITYVIAAIRVCRYII